MSDLDKKDKKDELLNHLIDAVLEAIKRGRAAWLLGIIIVFVFGIAVFNNVYSWNNTQIARRAILYGAAVGGYNDVELLIKENTRANKDEKTIAEISYKNKARILYGKKILGVIYENNIPNVPFQEKEIRKEAASLILREAVAESFKNGSGELGYISPIWKSCRKIIDLHKKDDCMKDLRQVALSDLTEHVNRRTAFDTVGIPFISGSVTGSDYGIVGGVALIIVGYWLLAMLRREHLALNDFVRIKSKGKIIRIKEVFRAKDKKWTAKIKEIFIPANGRLVGIRKILKSNENGKFIKIKEVFRFKDKSELLRSSPKYKAEDLVYACRRIKHYMVFSMPEKRAWLNYVTYASFLIAPLLLFYNHYMTVEQIYEKNLGDYWQWHVVAEGAVFLLGAYVWLTALYYQYRTLRIIKKWEVECGKINPFPDITVSGSHKTAEI